MNPKISIVVDAKNKAISTLTGMVTVGSKVDVEISGLPSVIPSWGQDDDYNGPSVRFRIVDELGKDIVRFPNVKKTTATDGDQWNVTGVSPNQVYKTYNGTSDAQVDFDTDLLRKAFRCVPFNEYKEFGIIIDSIVDSAQYAIGKIKIRQWSVASTEDPTVLPDWRETLSKLKTDLASVEQSKTAAQTYASQSHTSEVSAETYAGQASGNADEASRQASSASQSATSASQSATSASQSKDDAAGSATSASNSATLAQQQVVKYPYIHETTKHWMVWNANKTPDPGFEDTGIVAEGVAGTAATISVGTVTTGAAGSGATVTNVGTSSAAVFNFTIPKGDKGDQGSSDWGDIIGKPDTFPPSSHEHSAYSKMITTGSLGNDSTVDDIISKINTLISQLKG